MKHVMRTIDEYSENYYRLIVLRSPSPLQPSPAAAKASSQALLGTHKELLASSKLYRHLYYLEFNQMEEAV